MRYFLGLLFLKSVYPKTNVPGTFGVSKGLSKTKYPYKFTINITYTYY